MSAARIHNLTSRMALTLVELLVAMAILVTLSAATALIFRSIAHAWRTGSVRTERYQQARLLVDLFSRELSSSVSHVRFALVGIAREDDPHLKAGSAADELFFVGTLPGRAGLVERGYWLNASRQLMCHDDESGDGDYATGDDEVCGRSVTGFSVTYFDGTDWQMRWDGRAGQAQAGLLPKAIKLTLTLGEKNPESFETVIHVPTS